MRFRKTILICISFVVGLVIYFLLGTFIILPVAQITGIANVRLFCMYPEGDALRPAFCDEITAPDCGYMAAYGANLVHEYLEELQQLKNDEREYQAARQTSRIREIEQRRDEHQHWLKTAFWLYKTLIIDTANQFTQEECMREVYTIEHGPHAKELSFWTPYMDRFLTMLFRYRRTGNVKAEDLTKG